ncbi:MAG TPA: hypothetical protein HA362_04480 [Nanoarchaeota archaeon]|nr:hypothetical protein [Nanoarchaeota archaeon]
MPYYLLDKCPEHKLNEVGDLCERAGLKENVHEPPRREWEAAIHSLIYIVAYNPGAESPLLVQSNAGMDHTEPHIKRFLRHIVRITGAEWVCRWQGDNAPAIGREQLELSQEEIRALYRDALSSLTTYSGLIEEDLSLIERVALRRTAVGVFEGNVDEGITRVTDKAEAVARFMHQYYNFLPSFDDRIMLEYWRRDANTRHGFDVLREHFRIKSREYHKP